MGDNPSALNVDITLITRSVMKKLERLKLKKVASPFEHLDENSLAMLLGGYGGGTGGSSCAATGSSCGCDGTCVCNCNPPISGY